MMNTRLPPKDAESLKGMCRELRDLELSGEALKAACDSLKREAAALDPELRAQALATINAALAADALGIRGRYVGRWAAARKDGVNPFGSVAAWVSQATRGLDIAAT